MDGGDRGGSNGGRSDGERPEVSRDGGTDEGGSASDDDRSDGDGGATDEVSTAEMAFMVASATFTVALFGFALWHAIAGVGVVPPTVDVVGSQPASDGGVIYAIELRNPGDVGLVAATVSVECTDPPTEVSFENVPAQGQRSGSVRCPPGTTDPTVTVSDWVHE